MLQCTLHACTLIFVYKDNNMYEVHMMMLQSMPFNVGLHGHYSVMCIYVEMYNIRLSMFSHMNIAMYYVHLAML